MNDYGQGIKNQLELLMYVDKICRENNCEYFLFFSTLHSAKKYGDVAEWHDVLRVGLLYDDYATLIGKLKEMRGEYYPITPEIDSTFRDFYCRLYKRSKIVLEGERKKDERFYDSFINIVPIYEIANTEKEYRKSIRRINYYRKCITVREKAPNFPTKFRIKAIIHNLKRNYYLKKRTDNIVVEANEYVRGLHKKGARFVWFPTSKKLKGIVKCSDTYRETEDVLFAGYSVKVLRYANEWIDEYYGKKGIEEIEEKKPNIVLRDGALQLRRVQLVAKDILIEFDRVCRKNNIKYVLGAGTLLGAIRHKGFIPWDDDIDIFMLYEEWQKFEEVYKRDLDTERFFVRTQETDVDDNLVFFQIKRNETICCREGRMNYNTHLGVSLDILELFNGAPNFLLHKLQDKICKILKSATWAHMGAQSEKNFLKRKYYEFIQKHVSNKKTAELFYKYATKYKASPYLCYLLVTRNPYKRGLNQRKYYTELTEKEFEGHKFYVPKEYEELLNYLYSKDFMLYPSTDRQTNPHLAAHIELGDLYKFI